MQACAIAPENAQVFIHEVDDDQLAEAGILASDRQHGSGHPWTKEQCAPARTDRSRARLAVGAGFRCGVRGGRLLGARAAVTRDPVGDGAACDDR